MFSLRNSGDSLAGEFSRILKKSFEVKVTPEEMHSEPPKPVDTGASGDAGTGGDAGTDNQPSGDPALDNAVSPEDFLLTPDLNTATDSIDRALDSAIESHASSGHKLMAGLGKIASDLRGKGEAFAADMVEATAISISKDLSKEAAEKSHVINNLNKIASDFDNSGDSFAGDMVRVTIKNIIHS